MISGDMRRAQLIAPFGVGAMHVLADGTSVVTAGLDHWFPQQADGRFDLAAFVVDEPRLRRHLEIDGLYEPPDFRAPWKHRNAPNTDLKLPVLRFPRWSFCPRCKRLASHPLHTEDRPRCSPCDKDPQRKSQRSPFVVQVSFVALCERGHLQDFPWNEWVHRSAQPSCSGNDLYLRSSGGGTLAAQQVRCGKCDEQRSLEGITNALHEGSDGEQTSFLSRNLEPGRDAPDFLCAGGSPWLGENAGPSCGLPLKGSLRGASNVYFSLVKSSIFVPERAAGVAPELQEALNARAVLQEAKTIRDISADLLKAELLRRRLGANAWLLEPYTDEEVDAALARQTSAQSEAEPAPVGDPRDQAPFRAGEYLLIRDQADTGELVVRAAATPYGRPLQGAVSRVRLVDKLRETRVFWGFNRIYAEWSMAAADRIPMLRRHANGHTWLPACIVRGEGIYLELDPLRLADWEARQRVASRLARMRLHTEQAAEARHIAAKGVTPRFVLLHTLAHLLVNQLTYDCGYSSASLRERIYASEGADGMAGLLIYTAAGDSEGTMGGLVRMGEPGNLEPVLEEALSRAQWCSSDPVCMEAGQYGQGPDSCNLAACHSCALLPETACEEFNKFLDRGLLVGTPSNPDLGYFAPL